MSKHTPGPWEFVDNGLVGPKLDDKAVWLRPVILRSETGVSEANARLIVAAPDLLAALNDALSDLEYLRRAGGVGYARPDDSIIDAGHAAIAKATGGAE